MWLRQRERRVYAQSAMRARGDLVLWRSGGPGRFSGLLLSRYMDYGTERFAWGDWTHRLDTYLGASCYTRTRPVAPTLVPPHDRRGFRSELELRSDGSVDSRGG
jgi:hypothetical protein